MKTLLLTTLAILLITVIFAQAPQAFKYQAVIRYNQGKVLVNQAVSLQIFHNFGKVKKGTTVKITMQETNEEKIFFSFVKTKSNKLLSIFFK